MAADLHCHTTRSDGSDSPAFLVSLAARVGLTGLALTDHDCYAPHSLTQPLEAQYGIRVINGVECSCRDNIHGNKVHILCYNCKYPEAMQPVLQKTVQARLDAALQMIDKVAKLYPITPEMVMDGVGEGRFCGKQHIMLALMKAGYTTEMFGDVFHELFDKKTGRCFVPIVHTDVFETVKALRETGGVIVMAHPSVYGSIASLQDLIQAGIHGVELHHPRNKPHDIEILRQAVDEYRLLTTGGTDFHGYFVEKNRRRPLGTCTASSRELNALMETSSRLWAGN
ncbi:MAG: PHP domain-containing protein [Clostridia bacterium]|nr:PHP domain-containing protein [Clostridia bacterium]